MKILDIKLSDDLKKYMEKYFNDYTFCESYKSIIIFCENRDETNIVDDTTLKEKLKKEGLIIYDIIRINYLSKLKESKINTKEVVLFTSKLTKGLEKYHLLILLTYIGTVIYLASNHKNLGHGYYAIYIIIGIIFFILIFLSRINSIFK